MLHVLTTNALPSAPRSIDRGGASWHVVIRLLVFIRPHTPFFSSSSSSSFLFGLFMRDAVVHAVVKGGRCGIPCHRGSRLGAVNADPF